MKRSVLVLVILLASISVGSAFALTIRLAGDVTIDGTLTTGGAITSPTITNLQSQIDAVGPPVSPDADGDTLDGIDSTGLVSSSQSCPANQVVKGFTSGVEQCSQVGQTKTIRTELETQGRDGTSMVIGNDGFPIISFGDFNDARVIHCTNTSCSNFDASVQVVSTNVASEKIAIGIGGNDGFPVLAHVTFNGDVGLTHCTDAVCSTNDATVIIDDTDTANRWISMTIAGDGFPTIVYSTTDPALKVIHCTNATCSTRQGPNTVDTVSAGNRNKSIVLSNGFPLISYHDIVNDDLKVVHCTDVSCSSPVTPTLLEDGNVNNVIGDVNAITIGSDGLPIIIYNTSTIGSLGGPLKLIHCNNASCSGGVTPIVLHSTPNQDDTSSAMSIAIKNDGFPIIVFADTNLSTLKLIQCQSVDCSSFDPPEILDPAFNLDASASTAIAIASDGSPVVISSESGYFASRIGGLTFP